MLALIGSVALNMHLPKHLARTPNDLDIVGTYDDVQEFVKTLKRKGERVLAQFPIDAGEKYFIKTDNRIIEAEIVWPNSEGERLYKAILADKDTQCVQPENILLPSFNFLYMLKLSHRYLKDSPHFLKTMRDIQVMRNLGATLQPEHEEFLAQREKDTYNYSLPRLNVSKQEFFNNDNNIYTLDHDDIHKAVKHLDQPAYEKFKPDNNEVATSKDMFWQVDEEVRLYAALEEVMVLSIERSIHPFPNVDRRWAFDKAHEKLATSISSGWFREYVWENWDNVQGMYSEEYVDKFYAALHNGEIGEFKGG